MASTELVVLHQEEVFLADIELRCMPIYQRLFDCIPEPSITPPVRKAYEEAIRVGYEMGYRTALREAAAGLRGKLYKDNNYALPESIA